MLGYQPSRIKFATSLWKDVPSLKRTQIGLWDAQNHTPPLRTMCSITLIMTDIKLKIHTNMWLVVLLLLLIMALKFKGKYWDSILANFCRMTHIRKAEHNIHSWKKNERETCQNLGSRHHGLVRKEHGGSNKGSWKSWYVEGHHECHSSSSRAIWLERERERES